MVIFPKKRTIASQVCEASPDKYLKNKSDNSNFIFTLSDYRGFFIQTELNTNKNTFKFSNS